jgi:hypothetical protein
MPEHRQKLPTGFLGLIDRLSIFSRDASPTASFEVRRTIIPGLNIA